MQGWGERPARASVLGVLGLAVVAALGGACNLVNGSGNLELAPDLGTVGTLPDGGRGEGGAPGGGDGGGGTNGDGGTTTDAGSNDFIPDPGVNPKLSSCGTNLVCLPDVAGWSPALYLSPDGPMDIGCPPEYPKATDVQQSGGGGCDCKCSANNGSCAGSVDSMSGPLCAGAPVDLALTSGTCTTVNGTRDLPLPVAFKAHPSGPTPTSCGATVAPQLNKPQRATYCTGAMPSAGNCDQGEVCVPKPSLLGARFACILHDGNIACPNRLSFRSVVGAAITDGRSCGATCACQTQPCGGALQAFSDTACATLVRSLPVDGTCTTAGVAPSGASYRYIPSLGCGVSTPAKVVGSETYTGMQTLCCSFGF